MSSRSYENNYMYVSMEPACGLDKTLDVVLVNSLSYINTLGFHQVVSIYLQMTNKIQMMTCPSSKHLKTI